MIDPMQIAASVAESVEEARLMAEGTTHSPLLNLANLVRDYLDADMAHISAPTLATMESVVNARVVLRRAIAMTRAYRSSSESKEGSK